MNTFENSMTKTLTGAERACVMMITMGESRSKNILSQLESNEVEIISKAMKNLGKVSSSVVERVINFDTSRILFTSFLSIDTITSFFLSPAI